MEHPGVHLNLARVASYHKGDSTHDTVGTKSCRALDLHLALALKRQVDAREHEYKEHGDENRNDTCEAHEEEVK